MCLSFVGTLIPHEKLFLLTDRSFKPFFTKLITSFFLDWDKIWIFLVIFNKGFSHFDNLKYDLHQSIQQKIWKL